MSQFYITMIMISTFGAVTIRETIQMLTSITGLTPDGHIKAFAGIVQSVEHALERDQGRRWRITIL
jgi:hypothetical protein